MNPALPSLVLGLFIALGAPALAGGVAFDLPRLSFPEAPLDPAGQECAAPATISQTRCAGKAG